LQSASFKFIDQPPEFFPARSSRSSLTSKDERGSRRLDNSEDFVRMEIRTALERRIRVIPVLVDGALMPRADDLPEDLKPLVRRNALAVTTTSFEGDCQRLAATIRLVLEKAAVEERKRLATEQPQDEEAEQRQRLEKEQLGAKQREKERLETEQREKKPKLFFRLRLIVAKLSVQLTICAAIVIAFGVILFGSLSLQVPQRRVVSMVPDAAYYNTRGREFYERKEYIKVVSEYREAIRLDPNYAEAYYNMGLVLRAQNDLSAAQHFFDKAKQLGYTGPQPTPKPTVSPEEKVPPGVQALIEQLKDADADARHAAATSLGRMGVNAKGAVPALIQRVADDVWESRGKENWLLNADKYQGNTSKDAALKALKQLAPDRVEEALIEGMKIDESAYKSMGIRPAGGESVIRSLAASGRPGPRAFKRNVTYHPRLRSAQANRRSTALYLSVGSKS
jgi:tetratricopeptide (TPR) repeat protein